MENELGEDRAIDMPRGGEDELSEDAEEIVYKEGTSNQSSKMKLSKEKALAPLQIPEISCIQADYNTLNSDSRKLRRLQILNGKLISELADVKLSEESYMKDYKDEKRKCEILNKKCAKLEEKLASNNIKLDYFKKESEEMCKKVNRLEAKVSIQQGAMYAKLDDAQLMLENKYMELEDLCGRLEAFLRKNCGGEPAEAATEAYVSVQAVIEAEVICENLEMVLNKLPRVRMPANSVDHLSDFEHECST